MPRIDPVENPDDEQAKLLERTLRGPNGETLNIFRTLVHVPELMKRINALGGYFFVHGSIGTRERELVILRVARGAGSRYEEGQHRWIGAEAGLTPDEIEAALDPSRPHEWSRSDAALLRAVDEVLAAGSVGDDAWEGLAPELDDRGRLELLVLVGYYRMLAGVLNAVGVELEPSVADGPRT